MKTKKTNLFDIISANEVISLVNQSVLRQFKDIYLKTPMKKTVRVLLSMRELHELLRCLSICIDDASISCNPYTNSLHDKLLKSLRRNIKKLRN